MTDWWCIVHILYLFKFSQNPAFLCDSSMWRHNGWPSWCHCKTHHYQLAEHNLCFQTSTALNSRQTPVMCEHRALSVWKTAVGGSVFLVCRYCPGARHYTIIHPGFCGLPLRGSYLAHNGQPVCFWSVWCSCLSLPLRFVDYLPVVETSYEIILPTQLQLPVNLHYGTSC